MEMLKYFLKSEYFLIIMSKNSLITVSEYFLINNGGMFPTLMYSTVGVFSGHYSGKGFSSVMYSGNISGICSNIP